MDLFLADLRQSVRVLRKNPGFTIVAVAALALGIGANTGIFSVVDKVLLQPLSYPDPDSLVRLGRKYTDGEGYSNSIPKYMVWRNNTVFSAMTLYDQEGPGLNLSSGDRPEQIKGVHISADYFKVFGASPIKGRTFTPSEDLPNGPKAVIITENLWRKRFGADPNILNRTLVLNSEPYPVVGVIGKSFLPDPAAEVWIPLQADPNSANQGHYLAVAARLKPGVTLQQARSEMKVIGERFRRINPKSMGKNESVAVTLMRDAVVKDVKPALFILLGAVAVVLLIACTNVANLLLARAAVRQKELAIRAAIGAGRWRIIRQLLTESVLLAGIGGVCGFLLGIWGVRTLLLLVPGDIPRLSDPDQVQQLFSLLDWRIALFTVGVSILTGVLFGLFPALQVSSSDIAAILKEASSRSATGRRQNSVRKLLVAGEMALALVLLASATLLIRTFIGLSSADSGIDPHHVLTMNTSLVGQRYDTTGKVTNFTTQALRRIETIPGVASAATALVLPLMNQVDLDVDIPGKAPKAGEDHNGDEQWRSVSSHYFSVFKVPLMRGRVFDEHDAGNSAKVVIVNQSFAKKFWPHEDALGKVMIIGKGIGPEFDDPPRQVVGVVGNVRETGLADADVPVMYIPQSQQPEGLTKLASSALPMAWAVRSSLDTKSLSGAVAKEVQAVDGQMPLASIHPMVELLAKSTSRQNFNMLLLSIFAGVALVLAAIGIYGLMSYAVEQQTQEFGIRMALGAGKSDLLRLIVKQGMTPALIGVGIGLAAAFGATRLLSSLLYGVKPYDPLTFGLVAVVLSSVALFATYIPARRAMSVDPTIALREE